MLKLGLLWIAVSVVCLFIVKFTKIGPIVFSISIEHGWGVHSGDLLTLLPLMVGVIGTVWIHNRRVT